MTTNVIRDALGIFWNAIQNHFADYSGRADRREFWSFLCVYILLMAISVNASFLAIRFLPIARNVLPLAYLITLIPLIAIAVRRLHDTGLSGNFVFTALIPIIGTFVIFALLSRPSDGNNEYGKAPSSHGSVPEGF